MQDAEVLRVEGLNKYFYNPARQQVLDQVSFSVDAGEFVSIVGKSGCGKSTLLYILSTMDTDYEGALYLDKELITGKGDHELASIRNEKIGFVFQFHYLLPEFTVLKNVMLPGQKLGWLSAEELEYRAQGLLRNLDISDQALKPVNRLSGGQKQRVAIARALINDPLIIMGDEPTGNLDSKNSQRVFDIFKELAREKGKTLLIVTHDQDFAKRTDRTLVLDDGRLIR